MLVGLTYDLRSEYLKMGYSEEETAEFDKEETIEGIENALNQLGYKTDRIGHYRSLIERLLNNEKWDIVFNISEGMYGDGRESLVPALLDAWQIPYLFSSPGTLALSLNKSLCKKVIRDSGIPTPDFCLVSSENELNIKTPKFPLFLKPVAEGTGKGIDQFSIVKNEADFKTVCKNLLREYKQPVLVESYLPGREFTVGIVGNGNEAKVIGMMEVIFKEEIQKVYSYENKENYEQVISYQNITGEMFDKCADIALKAWNVTGSYDAGRVDLKCNEQGDPEFIEINPLAGLNLYHSDLPIIAKMNGMNFNQLISNIMQVAEKRIFNK